MEERGRERERERGRGRGWEGESVGEMDSVHNNILQCSQGLISGLFFVFRVS